MIVNQAKKEREKTASTMEVAASCSKWLERKDELKTWKEAARELQMELLLPCKQSMINHSHSYDNLDDNHPGNSFQCTISTHFISEDFLVMGDICHHKHALYDIDDN